MIAEIYLERADSEKNEFRYYSCTVSNNLFGLVQLDRKWGRIGMSSTTMTEAFDSVEDAVIAACRVQFVKEKRGYTTISCEIPPRPVVRIIPRRYHSYLSLKFSQLVEDDNALFEVSEKLRASDVVYVGQVVQLSELDVLKLIASPHEELKNLKHVTGTILGNLRRRLSDFGLSLNSSVPGWKRPTLQFPRLDHHPATFPGRKLQLVHHDS